MKPFLLILLVCLIRLPCRAAQADSSKTHSAPVSGSCSDHWFASDKYMHFSSSALLVCAGSAGMRNLDHSGTESLNTGIGLSVAMGFAKELRDMRRPFNHFCWKDIAADLLGIAFGIWIVEQWR